MSMACVTHYLALQGNYLFERLSFSLSSGVLFTGFLLQITLYFLLVILLLDMLFGLIMYVPAPCQISMSF